MKKQLARVFLSLIMVLSVSVCMLASAKSTMKVCTSAADLGEIVMDGYNLGEKGSVQIIEGTYTSNKGNTFDVYCCCSLLLSMNCSNSLSANCSKCCPIMLGQAAGA